MKLMQETIIFKSFFFILPYSVPPYSKFLVSSLGANVAHGSHMAGQACTDKYTSLPNACADQCPSMLNVVFIQGGN